VALTGGDAAHIRERFSTISDNLRPWSRGRFETEFASAASGALFQALLLYLARLQRREPGRRPAGRRSQAALDAVKERLDRDFQRPLRVADLAATTGLSRNFFALRFHQQFGTTVDGYLLHLRIEMARSLLLSTDQSIKEIAFECGIPDPHYFNKQFRRLTGISPTVYRARNRKVVK
jgi:AraC-like DNA-binding protein